MNIDARQHFWHYDPRRDPWITDEMAVLKRDFLPEDLIPQLHRVDGSIAVQTAQSEVETTFLLEAAEQFEEIKGVVGWVDLCAPNLPERLEHFSHFDKLCSFRHIVQSEPDSALITEADGRKWRQTDFAPYLDVIFDAFGTDRLMFGSDWPVCLLAADYPDVKQLIAGYLDDFSSEPRNKVLGANAVKFYGLKTSPYEPATER